MTQSLRLRSFLVCLALAACSTGVGPDEGTTPGNTPATVFAAAIVSEPVAAAVVSPASTSNMVYASLPPGTVSEGVSLTIVNHRNGARASAPIIAGGVDPVAIPASTGDTLGFTVLSAEGRAVAFEKIKVVPVSQPPIVVRTEPIQGKRDVPLNVRILVVFSEPIDPGTLTPGALQLQTGGVGVAGTVAFDDPDHLRATFTPAAPLSPGQDYVVVIAGTLQDAAGHPLIAPPPVGFTSVPTDPGTTPPTVFTAAILSQPLLAALVNPESTGKLVFVSLPPGTVPDGVSLSIVNHRNGARASGPIIAGGADPIAVAAEVDDTLGFIVISAHGLTVAPEQIRVVPSSQIDPVVIRTEPATGAQKVPLHAKFKVVFSVPVELGTLTNGGLRLQTGGVTVPGTMTFDGPDRTRVTFAPTDPLRPGRDYLLNVSRTIQDVAGNALLASVPVVFTSDVPVYSIYERVTPDPVGLASFYILSSDGSFVLKYGGLDWGPFFYEYPGHYQVTPTGISFVWDVYANNYPWDATATRSGMSFTVTYNGVMVASDFEHGTYSLIDGPGLP
ncbi:MAG: Ig-like domain-containing protein [Gemmatimonadota bacterium]